jgi:predicted ATPase
MCKGLQVVARAEWFHGEWAAVYPHGTRAAKVIRPCPRCAGDKARRAIAQRSNLEVRERDLLLPDWKVPSIPDHPGWMAQRRAARKRIEEAIEAKVGLYTFWGDFGAGKTMAAQIVVNELREQYAVNGVFATFGGILEHLRAMYGRNEDSGIYWERLLGVPVLVVDEVTRFNESNQWQCEKLFLLVNTRYRRKDTHLTLFTTNENPNQTLPPEEGIGYLFSRMREGKVIELRGDVRAALGGT